MFKQPSSADEIPVEQKKNNIRQNIKNHIDRIVIVVVFAVFFFTRFPTKNLIENIQTPFFLLNFQFFWVILKW